MRGAVTRTSWLFYSPVTWTQTGRCKWQDAGSDCRRCRTAVVRSNGVLHCYAATIARSSSKSDGFCAVRMVQLQAQACIPAKCVR